MDSPPLGDGVFDQLDIVAALDANIYLAGSYAATNSMVQKLNEPKCLGDVSSMGVDVGAPHLSRDLTLNSLGTWFMTNQNRDVSNFDDYDSADRAIQDTFRVRHARIGVEQVSSDNAAKTSKSDEPLLVSSTSAGSQSEAIDLAFVPEPGALFLVGVGIVASLIRRKAIRPRYDV